MNSHLQGPTTGGFGAIQTARGAAFNFSDVAQSKQVAEIETTLNESAVAEGDVLLELAGAIKTGFNGVGAALTCRLVTKEGDTVPLVTVVNMPPGNPIFFTARYYATGGEKVFVDFNPGAGGTAGKGAIFVKFVGLGKP
jgi:hypothetical protein